MAKVVTVIIRCEGSWSSRNTKPQREICWESCVLCRMTTTEPVVCPANSKPNVFEAGYKTLALDLARLKDLNKNPFGFDISDLENGVDIKFTLRANNAC